MSTSETGPGETSWKSILIRFRWPLAVTALGLFGLLALLSVVVQARRAASGAGDLARAAAERAERIAAAFLTGDVTERFVASIPEVEATGRLEVATAEVVETFTRSDERRVFFDAVSLGTTVSEIKVPVTYRYHLLLADPWRITVDGPTCVVHAPALRPSQPPAIHTDRMEKRVEQGWLRFDAAEQLEALERSLTPRLVARARDPRHLALVREPSRKAVAEFVRAWLLKEDQWRRDRLRAIEVVFADEDPAGSTATLRLESG